MAVPQQMTPSSHLPLSGLRRVLGVDSLCQVKIIVWLNGSKSEILSSLKRDRERSGQATKRRGHVLSPPGEPGGQGCISPLGVGNPHDGPCDLSGTTKA